MTASAPARTRDPARKERILRAAAELIARDGFHPVSMAEIGRAAGVTGSAIYRHFDSKVAVLVALLDRAVDALLEDARATVADTPDLGAALCLLVDQQVEFAVTQRAVAQVYYREAQALPEEDGRRLRRNQRAYVEVWVHVLLDLHPGTDEERVRALVHAAIGAVQSTLFQSEGLRGDASRDVLRRAAGAVLGVVGTEGT